MGTNIQFNGELTAAYQCSDLKRTIEWYGKHLDFSLIYEVEGYGWCEFATHIGNVAVGFSQVESPKVEGGPTLTFGVADIEAARSALEVDGVRFDGDIHVLEGLVKLTTFFDPDGNHLMFAQSLANQ